MSTFWLSVFTIGLGATYLSANLFLLFRYVNDWRRGRGEVAAQRRPKRASTRAKRRQSAASGGLLVRPALPAAFILAVPPIAASAQETSQVAEPQAAGTVAEAASAPAAPPQSQASPYHVQLNFDYTTAYFYHGIIQEDSGLILQPAARLTINLYEEGDFKVDALLGTWNSFQGQKTGAQTSDDFTDYWYESDLFGGLTISKGKLSLAANYVFLTSPSDAYETVQELDLTLAFDDGEALGAFALHPYALLAIETGADCSDGANSDPGIYLELGIAPGFSFDAGSTPVTISFPASIGLSLKDYYQNTEGDDDTFGFAQVGVKASLPLPFGERWGAWTLSAGVYGLFLGDHTADYNGGDQNEIIGTVGIQVNF